jgi:beta-phosphoglucomutase-like phosphatase (HAD superfamily)
LALRWKSQTKVLMGSRIQEIIEQMKADLKEKETFYTDALKKGHSYDALKGVKELIENLKKEIALQERSFKSSRQ